VFFFVVYLKQLIRTVTNKETNKMKTEKTTYYLFHFVTGGWNYVQAKTEEEARIEAKNKFPNNEFLPEFHSKTWEDIYNLYN